MKTFFLTHYPLIATAIFVGIILIAHFFVSDGYSIFTNTISDLGAQQYTHAWIMRLGFFLFGGITILGVLLNGISLRTAPILLYGGAIFMTGIFSEAPFFPTDSLHQQEADLHSLFAQIAGISFSLGVLLQIFYAKTKPEILLHVLFFLGVISFSAGFGLVPEYQGIFQRLLYTVSLVWYAFFFSPL